MRKPRSYLRIITLDLLIPCNSPLAISLATSIASFVLVFFDRRKNCGARPVRALPKWYRENFGRISHSGHRFSSDIMFARSEIGVKPVRYKYVQVGSERK